MIKTGQIYRSREFTSDFLLAQVECGRVALIMLRNGNRLNEPVFVGDVENITKGEWQNIAGEEYNFTLTGVEKSPIKMGQRFLNISPNSMFKGDEYLLASVDSGRLALISLKTGERWRDGVKVEDVENVSKTEWFDIASSVVTGDVIFEKIED